MPESARKIGDILRTWAKKLLAFGYSVIPVCGDKMPREPKKAAVPWRGFQRRRPDPSEIDRFFRDGSSALGIVCGTVSRLLVIDFDDHLRYQRFCRHLPQYAGAYTVKTRRGYHVYFRSDVKVPTHQFEGGDIKGERSYVVAEHSRIGDVVYRRAKGHEPMELTGEDVERILRYFHRKSQPGAAVASQSRTRARDLPGSYRRLAGQVGRNNALYRCACLGRDGGLSQSAVERELLPAHVDAPARAGHKRESERDRWEEGIRTITSAFSYAARESVGRDALPNTIREKLLSAQKSTVVARLIDGMALAGWEAESYFKLSEAIALGRDVGLSRKSVLSALTGEHSIFNGRHIISRRYVEYMDSGGLKWKKRGRPPALVFQAPSVGGLMSVLGVSWSPGDRLEKADLRSAHSYRLALHREYIKRAKPQLTLGGLAGRIGVHARTIGRYNRALGVVVIPVIGRLRLSRWNVICLPKGGREKGEEATPGFWLERGNGQRLPAWREAAWRVLRDKGGDAWICLRRGSRYSLDPEAQRGEECVALARSELEEALRRRGFVGDGGLLARVGAGVERLRQRVAGAVYERVRLYFASVLDRIAEDKIAETIGAYLVAYDSDGRELRRPARRGIAFRMLKEFGEGEVYLALKRGSPGAGEGRLAWG